MIDSVFNLTNITNHHNRVKLTKVTFMALLCLSSLCLIGVQQVFGQTTITDTVYILSDGSISCSSNSTVNMERDGDVYTFTADMSVYSFVVQRSNIVIDGAGYALQGQGDVGIDIEEIGGVTIQNLDILGSFNYGIYVSGSAYNTFTDNIISGCGVALLIYNSTQNTITGNTIVSNNLGLDLRLASDNTLRNNSFDNFRNLAFYGTTESDYVNDIDDSNTIGDGKKIYYLVDEQNLAISSTTYPDIGFLALVGCSNVTVQGVELSANEQGLIISDSTDCVISQITITDTSYAVVIFSSSSITITQNTLTGNNRAVHLKDATFCTISANDLTGNVGGIFLFDSIQNTVSGNTIQDNESYGVGISASSYNLFRGNHFLNNGLQVYDAGLDDSELSLSINTWFVSYPAGGNYWSDYHGTDAKSGTDQDQEGSDGIGDTPYTIYATVTDDYPLIVEGALLVSVTSPQNKTYTQTSVSLTVTVSDSNAIVGYSLDGQANMTYSGSTNLSSLSEGSHEVTVFAKNTEGKESSQTVYFTVSGEDDQTPINGDHPEDLDLTLVAAIAAIAVVGVVLLYFFILKKK